MSNQAGAVAIEVRRLSKEYHIAGSKGANRSNSFFALRDVSFTLYKGDVMGIIGSNGSGKTTLLKILSQVIQSTSGEAHFYGTATSILDIGSNFHPDLTGRENVHMQLKLSGIASREFEAYYGQIKSFSEIGDFFDQPVKVYSSGMFLRLAFSIAFHLSSSILIIDEVLSVGDEGFRLKCQELLKMFKEQGRTILLVSHNKAEILELCNKCIWLDKGEIKKTGYPAEVLSEYFVMHRDNYDGKKQMIGIEKGSEANISKGIIDLDWSESESPGNEILAIRHIFVGSAIEGDKIYYEDEVQLKFLVQKKASGNKNRDFLFFARCILPTCFGRTLFK